MYRRFKAAGVLPFLFVGALAFCSPAANQSGGSATIRRVGVLNQGSTFELEIDTSQPVTPQTQIITGPDRLVIDFPNAVPGPQLRPLAVKAQQVKGVRVGLFASNPPVARIVLDLNSPQSYEVFPSGNSVIVKLKGSAHLATVSTSLSRPSLPSSQITSSASVPAVSIPAPVAPPPDPPKPPPAVQVQFADGKLWVSTDRAMLGEVLREIGKQTGATVSVPAQANQEPIVAHLGPAPAREVLAALLSGAPYNVVLLGSGRDLSRVTSIVLTPRAGGEGATMPANFTPAPTNDAAPDPEPVQPAAEPETPNAPPPQDTLPPSPQ